MSTTASSPANLPLMRYFFSFSFASSKVRITSSSFYRSPPSVPLRVRLPLSGARSLRILPGEVRLAASLAALIASALRVDRSARIVRQLSLHIVLLRWVFLRRRSFIDARFRVGRFFHKSPL